MFLFWRRCAMSVKNKEEGLPFMQHWVAEMYEVSSELLDSEEQCKTKLLRVTAELGLSIWTSFAYKFNLGVSAFVVISESHVALHTWPEYRYAHVDIITCSEKTDFEAFRQALLTEFIPNTIKVTPLN